MSKLPLIEKIHLLESKLGDRWSHPILEPFKFDSSDPIKVQGAGKIIAQHLGLPPFTFIISYAQQESNVGGHINLDYNKDIYIEIDGKYKNDCDIVLAVLAHEICHKYLHINNIELFPKFENEMLTDAATVYTGLGKLSLNGIETKSVSSSKSGDTTTTTTTTRKVGYMDRQQLAFVYLLVCEMRRIPQNEMLQGLTPAAAQVVRNVSVNDHNYFNETYFSNDFTLTEINSALGDTQINFAKFNKNIRIIQESVLTSANQIYDEFHLFTKAKTEKIYSAVSKTFNKESHNYIKNLIAIEELESLKSKIDEKDWKMRKFGNALPKFINSISTTYPEQFSKKNLEFLSQFDCPTCNNKMRIGVNKLARVKCPKCNYSFIIDTGVEETLSTVPKNFGGINKQNRRVLWRKIKTLFRKIITK